MYQLIYEENAKRDLEEVKKAKKEDQLKELLDIIQNDPYQTPPDFVPLVGNLEGLLSRRITFQHRMIYQVDKETETITLKRVWAGI